MLEMTSVTPNMRAKQIIMALGLSGLLALFIALPLMARDYPVRQGVFEAEILSTAAGMGMAGKPILRARVEDGLGRTFWLALPPSHLSAPGTPLKIDVWCETEGFERCVARYRPG